MQLVYLCHLSIYEMNMHNGEKPSKCNFCDFTSTRTGHFRTVKKNPKSHLCKYSCIEIGTLWVHIKTHNQENLTNAIDVIL